MKTSENTAAINKFIRENRSLFHNKPEEMREEISHKLLVETVLNYRNEETVKKMFEIFGAKYAVRIFSKQIRDKSVNYFPQAVSFYTEIF